MRTWTDLDRNGSALDADGNAQYAEIGDKVNANFGLPAGSARFDASTPRPTNWETTVSVVHELLPRVAVTGGYYRRTFQNISVTRNAAITLADYTPYKLTAPLDPRLPGGGGEVIGMYNLLPVKNGVIDQVSTYSSENTRLYNGVEVSVNARLPLNGFIFGGVTTERIATNTCDGPVTNTTLNTFSTNPDNLRFCDLTPPFRSLYKLSGGYTLPYSIQVSGSLQAVPGADIAANYTFNSAVAGVTLTGANSRTITLVEPNTLFLDYQTQLDARLSRTFRFGTRRFQPYVDIFNLLNASSVAQVNTTYTPGASNNWLKPLVVMQARRFQVGGRFDF